MQRDRARYQRSFFIVVSMSMFSTSWAADASDPSLEEIVVTASKRSETEAAVPMSLSVLQAGALQAQGASNFEDYMTLVPGLAFASGGATGNGTVIMRGLNTGYSQTSNTAGFYIDDSPFSATSPLSVGALVTPEPDLGDIDHIEVLKGPQSTLYGASALGGIIKVVSKQPDLSGYSGRVEAEGSSVDHGGEGYGVSGMANIPLVMDQLAVRISAFHREEPGYMTNVTLDTHNRDATEKNGGRVALKWKPSDNLDVEISAAAQRIQTTGYNYEDIDLATQQPTTGRYQYASAVEPRFDTSYRLFDATVNYVAGDLGTLTSSTSYSRYTNTETYDYTPYAGFLNDFAPTPVPDNTALALVARPALSKLSEELRFAANRQGSFEWLAGLFFTREQIGFDTRFENLLAPSYEDISGPSALVTSQSNTASYREVAGFADVTYYFREDLDLMIGGRTSQNHQQSNSATLGFLGASSDTVGASDHDFTYLVTLRWRPTANLNTYARIASAYRPGGPEIVPTPEFSTFRPDTVVNYEIGAKGEWLDGLLNSSIALYYMNWNNVQIAYSDILPTGAVAVEIANGTKAVSKGVEWETQFKPVRNLSLSVSAAYTDAALTSADPNVTASTGAVSGDRLPFTPLWAATLSADYKFPLAAHLTGAVGSTFSYQGDRWSDYPGDTLNTGVRIPAYSVVNFRASASWDKYVAQLRVENAFNKYGLVGIVDQRFDPTTAPPAWASVIAPRTVVLALSATF